MILPLAIRFFPLLLSLYSTLIAEMQVTLRITKSFSQQPILHLSDKTRPLNVIELLKAHTDLKTGFGGGFVNSINGIQSVSKNGETKDWFYYVNGILAPVGAKQYQLHHEDMIWWDFHHWKEGISISALVGAYPHPFLGGYRGKKKKTVVAHAEGFQALGQMWAEDLEKHHVDNVQTAELSAMKDFTKSYLLLIGAYKDLVKNKQTLKFFENADKLGFFVRFNSEEKLELRYFDGKPAKKIDGGATLIAGKVGQNGAVWIVTGNQSQSIKEISKLFLAASDKTQFGCGIALSKHEIITLPVW